MCGVAFIDHTNKIAFNGSRIGKEYSANAMNDWFSTLKDSGKNNNQSEKNIFISLFSEALLGNSNLSENSDNYYPDISNDKGLTTFHITAGAPDPEEEEFIRRMRTKKRKEERGNSQLQIFKWITDNFQLSALFLPS